MSEVLGNVSGCVLGTFRRNSLNMFLNIFHGVRNWQEKRDCELGVYEQNRKMMATKKELGDNRRIG